MIQWFEVTISRSGFNEKGIKKNIKEKYLFDAVSFTEAEKRVFEELKGFDELEVKRINPIKVSEIFLTGHGDIFFKCKVNYITLDEKSGKEKKKPFYVYVQAENTKNAEAYLTEGMKGTISDWSCESISETKIVDVMKYDLKEASEKIPEVNEEKTV